MCGSYQGLTNQKLQNKKNKKIKGKENAEKMERGVRFTFVERWKSHGDNNTMVSDQA